MDSNVSLPSCVPTVTTSMPTYEDADIVVVNTCGFIDDAKRESLEAIGEALQENGKVIVTGCMGNEADKIKAIHPGVLSVTSAHAYEDVVSAVHQYVPQEKPHNPLIDLVPPGHQADTAPLRLSEDLRRL
ncbi:MAG: hypothetical protein R3F38_07030 [Gammaproteobacteria bacterium]